MKKLVMKMVLSRLSTNDLGNFCELLKIEFYGATKRERLDALVSELIK